MDYYVYLYLREDGSPYYVGKGKDIRYRRPHDVPIPTEDNIWFFAKDLTEEDAFDIERELIGQLTGLLNKTAGGQGSSGRVLSKETRQKLGNGMRGRKHTEETKAKMRLKRRGRKPCLGKSPSQETRDKISNANKGKKRTPESKQKIADALKGRTLTKNHCENISKGKRQKTPINNSNQDGE